MAGLTKEQCEVILTKQSFGPAQPGQLLGNIQTLIEALGSGIETTSKYFALPIRCLSDLNERMETPVAHKMQRPQLKSFPTLAGLFLLLRASGLAVGETKPKRKVLIDPDMREKWNALNPTEQYMSLLDAWLTKVNWSILGESDRFGRRLQSDTCRLYYQLREQKARSTEGRYHLFYSWELRVAASLLEQFGWLRLTYASKVEDGKVADIQSVERTEFGDAMFATLGDILGFDRQQESPVEDALKHLYPQWKNSLLPDEQPFREGRYTLKLSWSTVWRRLVAPATTSLEDVTSLLLRAFEFDQDHLYQLGYRNPSGKEVVIVDPQIGEGEYFADEVRLGDLPLSEGDSIGLWYDFGDDWRFTITIESIDESVTGKFKPKITAKRGKAPRQYDFGDDEVEAVDED